MAKYGGKGLLRRRLLLLLPALLSLVAVDQAAGQFDGSFWWMNGDLLKQAEALRESKDVKAIVISKDSELDEVRVGGNSLVDGDAPDCICVPLGRCAGSDTSNNPSTRDGLCGPENICCRKHQIIAIGAVSSSITSTTIRSTTVSSTKLKPVDNLIFDSPTISSSLPETIPFNQAPLNDSEHDPALLLELSNLLLSHSIVDSFDTTNSNALEWEESSTTETSSDATSTIPVAGTTTKRPAHSQCGVRRSAVSSRIFFQDEDEVPKQPLSGITEFGEFPWTVAIYQLIRNGTFVYHCGGALLRNRVVVTAAHCVSNNRLHPNRFVVHAGDWDRRHRQEKLPHQERIVSRIIVHPNYYSGALFNDVALLIFEEPFDNVQNNVDHVCLPTEDMPKNASNCMVTGWGGSPKNNRAQSIQQYTKLSMLDQQNCETRLQDQPTLGKKFKLHDSFICAGGEAAVVDTCQGAGGSPFVCESSGLYYLMGLVSWGIGCGDGIPAVLSSIGALSEWIRANQT